VEDPERFYRFGERFYNWSPHFLARARKQKQKKTPVSRSTLRVVAAAGAHGNSPRLRFGWGGTQTVRALYSVRPADARRGTKGSLKTKDQNFILEASF